MRNTQFILGNWRGAFPKTLAWHAPLSAEPVEPHLALADEVIYWRARALDQTTCLIIHEWLSLERMVDLDVSIIVLMRDPRDIVNSHFWHTRAETDLSDEDHLLRILEGYTRYYFGEPAYKLVWPSVPKIIESFRAAVRSPNMYVVRFEDLYNGCEATLQTLMTNLRLAPSPFCSMDDAFYSHATYLGSFEYQTGGSRKRGENFTGRFGGEHSSISARKGIVGDWRSSFTPAVVERFKDLTGDALVRLGYESDSGWDL